jgi:hypothetical protein
MERARRLIAFTERGGLTILILLYDILIVLSISKCIPKSTNSENNDLLGKLQDQSVTYTVEETWVGSSLLPISLHTAQAVQ